MQLSRALDGNATEYIHGKSTIGRIVTSKDRISTVARYLREREQSDRSIGKLELLQGMAYFDLFTIDRKWVVTGVVYPHDNGQLPVRRLILFGD